MATIRLLVEFECGSECSADKARECLFNAVRRVRANNFADKCHDCLGRAEKAMLTEREATPTK